MARRRRAFKVFNQIYFNKSWIDVLFLKHLKENKNLLLPQSKVSTPFLRHLTNTKYDVVIKFLVSSLIYYIKYGKNIKKLLFFLKKMLQARSPLYNEQAHKCPDKKVFDKHREAHLNRVQYQTRRTMLTQMRNIRRLRQGGDIEVNNNFPYFQML